MDDTSRCRSSLRQFRTRGEIMQNSGYRLPQPGKSRPLLNVPINNLWNVAWSPDSKAVAIGRAYLPLDNTTGGEREQRRQKTFNVEVKVPEGDITTISGAELK